MKSGEFRNTMAPRALLFARLFAPLFSVAISLGSAARPRELPLPGVARSFETITPHIQDVMTNGNTIWLIPRQNSFVIEAPFNAEGKTAEETFGKLTDSKRHGSRKGEAAGPWTSVEYSGGHVLLVDGLSAKIASFTSSWIFDVERDLVYDRVSPPADSRGEPPEGETNRLRTSFVREFSKFQDERILAFRRVPKSWNFPEGTFLALSGLKKYRLLQLTCAPGDPAGCVVSRACHIEGMADRLGNDLTGMALDRQDKIVVLGDQSKRQLHFVRFHSCFHALYQSSIGVPSRLKELAGISTDDQNRLWLATRNRDDYHNASVFFWEPADWRNP